MKLIDLTGQKFNYLTAIKYVGHGKWLLRCDCGREVVRLSSNFKKRHISSCGCISKNPGQKDAGFKRLFNDYRQSAQNRGYSFELQESIFKKLIESNCYYCDSPPSPRYKKQVVHTLLANGIDRIDSAVGYIQSNVVPCCKNCNIAKGSLTQKDFLTLIGKIWNNIKLRENSND